MGKSRKRRTRRKRRRQRAESKRPGSTRPHKRKSGRTGSIWRKRTHAKKPTTISTHAFSPNGSREYWRGVIARLEWLIDDAAADDDTPDIKTPNEPLIASQFWAGWNSIVRRSPENANLQTMIGDARLNMAKAK